MKYYISLGAERQKLVIGIPTYGRSYTLLDGNFTDFGASADGPGEQGKYTKENGFMAFYEVCVWTGFSCVCFVAVSVVVGIVTFVDVIIEESFRDSI